jgi:hypothetical protein
LVAIFYFVHTQFLVFSTERQELERLQKCNLSKVGKTYDPTAPAKNYRRLLTDKCNRVILKLMERLSNEPAMCKRIAKRILSEKDWKRQNRLLHVLLRSQHAKYWGDQTPAVLVLRRQPCVEESVVQMVSRWNQNMDPSQNPGGIIPGVAQYNLHYLNQSRFLVTKTYVLKRVQLPRPVARRLATHLLRQFRSLNQGASKLLKASIKKLFDNVFYPLWTKLGSPE